MTVGTPVVVTATLTCQRCFSSLPVSWPIRLRDDGHDEWAPLDGLAGSEQILLALFAELHEGPFVAATEASGAGR